MNTFSDSITAALELIRSADPVFLAIVARSMAVSAAACVLACGAGLVLGAWLGVARFRGRGVVLTLLNTFLALPSVVVGLTVYLLLSRSGPLGFLGWLFSFKAMVLAQAILVLPVSPHSHARRWKTPTGRMVSSCARWVRGRWCAACCWCGTSGMRCSPWSSPRSGGPCPRWAR